MKTESERLWHLRKLIQEFEEVDRKIPAGLESGTIEVIKHVIEKKENIKEFLIEYQHDHLPEQLSNKLRNIRDNCGGYYIDRFNDELQNAFSYELAQKANEEMSEWIGGNDWVGKIVGTDLQEYVNEHYHRRKRAIWPFLLKRTLPYNLLNHLNNIRECFAI